MNAPLACRDLGLAANASAIFHERFQFDVRISGGMDVAAGQENLRRKPHRFRKVRGDRSECGQKQIAKAVTFKTGAFFEAVTEELRKQRFILAKGDDAVPDVARRKHVEFFAQATARSAIVADCYYRTKIANERWPGLSSQNLVWRENKSLE